MEKIPTCFERDWEGDRSRVLDQVHPGCEWVMEGEGVATRKLDGTCVRLDEDGKWWARREVKDGKESPHGFVPVAHDHITLAAIGWEPIEGTSFSKWHTEALEHSELDGAGTYELLGPKVNKNPEGYENHILVKHEHAERYIVPRTYEGMRDLLAELDVEGFVFHHENGRWMAKIKRRDFGFRRGEFQK